MDSIHRDRKCPEMSGTASLPLPRHVHKPGRLWIVVSTPQELADAIADGWYVDAREAYAVSADEPYTPRSENLTKVSVLRHGNPSGNPATAPRCGARARTRGGAPCQAPAVRGKRRCRLHGGLSTGPRTPEGLERSRRARLTHGRYSVLVREQRRAEQEQADARAKEQARSDAVVLTALRRVFGRTFELK